MFVWNQNLSLDKNQCDLHESNLSVTIRRRESLQLPYFPPQRKKYTALLWDYWVTAQCTSFLWNQDTDKTSNSSDPTLQILYGQPWKHGNVNNEKKQNSAHGRSLEVKKHLQALHWKNSPLRKKVKQQHVKDAGKCVNLDTGWAWESFSNLGPRHLEPHW